MKIRFQQPDKWTDHVGMNLKKTEVSDQHWFAFSTSKIKELQDQDCTQIQFEVNKVIYQMSFSQALIRGYLTAKGLLALPKKWCKPVNLQQSIF